jgi:hypothetical protein
MEFHAHRAVLACASPHLFELFTADDESKGSQRENVITYKLNGGYDRTALEKLIHYAYTARYVRHTVAGGCMHAYVSLESACSSGI